jgi:Raf kinase inhibitor-like YbhB/YbcL family protein
MGQAAFRQLRRKAERSSFEYAEVIMSLTLSSAAFSAGERIPAVHTCDGGDVSPPLAWTGAPAGVRSFAVVCTDPDAPVGTWYHWVIFDIPENITELGAGYAADARVGTTRQALNDFKRTGYGGPCPPRGHGVHRYHFRLMALDVDRIDASEPADARDVEREAERHLLDEAVLIGTYAR